MLRGMVRGMVKATGAARGSGEDEWFGEGMS